MKKILFSTMCICSFACAVLVITEGNETIIDTNATGDLNVTGLPFLDLNATDANVTVSVVDANVTASSSADLVKGEAIYKKCIACHGAKANTKYLNKVPALIETDSVLRAEKMAALKAGNVNDGKGYFGLGGVMKAQMSSLSDEDIANVNAYIDTLK